MDFPYALDLTLLFEQCWNWLLGFCPMYKTLFSDLKIPKFEEFKTFITDC